MYRAILGSLLLLTVLGPASLGAQPADTEPEAGSSFRPLHDLDRTVRLFVSDAAHIYTFPLHMDRRDWLVFGGALAVTGLAYAYDEDLLEMAHRNEDSALLKPLWELGDFVEPAGHMGNTNVWYLGGAALGYVTRQDRLTLICVQILESHYIAGLGKNAMQAVIGRPRPFEGYGPREFGQDDTTSFPSGHASNIFQVAAVLSHHADWKPFTIAAYTTATAVGIQRVRSDMHWSSDVLLSSFYGWSVAKGVLRLHEGRRTIVEPHLSGLGVGLQVAFRY